MLKLSRLENGATELKAERTDLVYLVRSLVSSQHQLFHEKGLHLRFVDETPHGELYADVDPDLLREAIVNLMSNAMRYTNADGWVKVSLRQERSDVLIAVQDTGIGIAKEDIPQTFARFWRSDVSRERVSGGLGRWPGHYQGDRGPPQRHDPRGVRAGARHHVHAADPASSRAQGEGPLGMRRAAARPLATPSGDVY